MKKFIFKIVNYTLLTICIMALLYIAGTFYSERHMPEADIYIWGDSQLCSGLDIKQLSDATHKIVESSALHGSGVYDFLIFAECVKPKSICIIAFPESAFYRNPNSDYSRSGMNLNVMLKLIKSGYSIKEVYNIFTLNQSKVIYKPFVNENVIFPYSDTIVYNDSNLFYSAFHDKTSYSDWKICAYKIGLQELLEKECSVIIVRYPYHRNIEEIASGSINRHRSEALTVELCENYDIDMIHYEIDSDSLLFHDFSHFNEIGVRKTTNCIIEELSAFDTNKLIQISVARNDD